MPIDDRRRMRDIIEQSAPGAHRGNDQREPSDPPASGEMDSVPPRHGSFRRGIAHLSDAAGKMSKRVTVMLAAFGALSTAISIGFSYWSANQGFIKQDQWAQLNRKLDDIELAQKAEALTRQTMQEHVKEQDDLLFEHTNELAQLTNPEKKVRKKTP